MSKIPKVGSSSSYYKNYYNENEIIRTEIECLRLLEYKLNHFTAFHFIQTFLCMGIITEDELSCIDGSNLKREREYNGVYSSRTPSTTKFTQYDDLDLKSRGYSGYNQGGFLNNNYLKTKTKYSTTSTSSSLLDKIYGTCFELLELSVIGNPVHILN